MERARLAALFVHHRGAEDTENILIKSNWLASGHPILWDTAR